MQPLGWYQSQRLVAIVTPMEETFGQRLRRLREERGLSQREVAEAAGHSRVWMVQLEGGTRWLGKLPPYDDLRLIAKALSLTVDELVGDEEPPPVLAAEESIQALPITELLRRAKAWPYRGRPIEGIAASAGRGSQVPQDFDYSRAQFGEPPKKGKKKDEPDPIQNILVEGDCMVDLLFPGDIVAVDIRLAPEIGDVVVAMRFHDEVLVKFLRLDGEHQYLESKDGRVIPLDQYIRILGPVVSFQRGMRGLLHVGA